MRLISRLLLSLLVLLPLVACAATPANAPLVEGKDYERIAQPGPFQPLAGKIEVVEVFGYTCPHCGRTFEIFGTGGGEKTALATGLPFLGRIPFDPDMVKCADAGISYQSQHGSSPAAVAFKTIADLLSNSTNS